MIESFQTIIAFVAIGGMKFMYFIIDYENVNIEGLKGSSLLNEDDTIEIFYSAHAPTIKQGVVEKIAQTGAKIRYTKLKTPRKNALDFYITARIGVLIGKGITQRMAIIAKDTHYKAVKEYFECISDDARHEIVLHTTIMGAIIEACEPNARTKMAREYNNKIALDDLNNQYKTKALKMEDEIKTPIPINIGRKNIIDVRACM